MTESATVPFVCHLDFVRRSSLPARRWTVLIAGHLAGHPSLPLAEPLLADMRDGRSLARHLPPLKNQKHAYKRAHRKGTWRDYRRMMDHLHNKWSFRHFHCGGGSVLAFVHLHGGTGIARVLDLVPHDGDWLLEKRLVETVVRNWPDADIARGFGEGPYSMTEADLFAARKQGLNMTVNVDGTYYLPAGGALMSDGSSYGGRLMASYYISGQRYVPGKPPAAWLDSPHSLVVGLDPEDPRPHWALAAAQAGLIASGTRSV